MSSIPDDKVLMKEIRQHIHDLALEYGQDGVSYILVKDKLIDKYVPRATSRISISKTKTHTNDRYGRDKVRGFKSKIYKEIEFYIEAVTEPMTAPPRPPPQVLRSARQSQRRRRRHSTIVKSKVMSPTFVQRTHRRTKTDGDVYRHRVDSQALSSLRHFESDSAHNERQMLKKESSSLMMYREQSKRDSVTISNLSISSDEGSSAMYVM